MQSHGIKLKKIKPRTTDRIRAIKFLLCFSSGALHEANVILYNALCSVTVTALRLFVV